MMKKKTISAALALLAIAMAAALGGCATTKGNTSEDSGPLYIEGHKDMTLAILRPAGDGFAPVEEVYLDIIQAALSGAFLKFSDITQIDRQNLERLQQEQDLQGSDSFDEKSVISFGKMRGYQYVLMGRLVRTGPGQYQLTLNITDTETGIVKASAETLVMVKNMAGGARAAAAALLPQMGVELTAAGKKALSGGQPEAELDSDNALALSYEAERKGNFMEAMILAYSAEDSDGGSAASREQSEAMFKMMGGEGAAIKDDYSRQQFWKKQLIAFEEFYLNHSPFDVFYTSVPVKEGGTDYDTAHVAFKFDIGLRGKRGVRVMRKVLRDVVRELNKTDHRKRGWGFENWPSVSASSTKADQIPNPLFIGSQTFTVTMGIFNGFDECIATLDVPLYGQLAISGYSITFDATQTRHMIFRDVPVDALTDNMQIRAVSINGRLDMAMGDYMRVRMTDKMPLEERGTIAKAKRAIPELPEEKAAREARAEEERERRDAQAAKRRRAEAARKSRPLANRFGVSGGLLFNPASSAEGFQARTSWAAGADIGVGNLTGEFRVSGSLTTTDGSADTLCFGGALGYTFIGNRALFTLGAGGSRVLLGNGRIIDFVPSVQARVDLAPAGGGLALRLGYFAEFGGSSWGDDDYGTYFNETTAVKSGPVFFIGRPFAGLVLWL